MTESAELVLHSLDRVAELVDDPSAPVYERLFAEYPEFKKLWSTRGLRTDPPSADFDLAREQIVRAARAIVDGNPPDVYNRLNLHGFWSRAR